MGTSIPDPASPEGRARAAAATDAVYGWFVRRAAAALKPFRVSWQEDPPDRGTVRKLLVKHGLFDAVAILAGLAETVGTAQWEKDALGSRSRAPTLRSLSDTLKTPEEFLHQGRKALREESFDWSQVGAAPGDLPAWWHLKAPQDPADQLPTRSRRTLLVLVAALCQELKLDPKARGTAKTIEMLTEKMGVPISEDAIKRYLDEIPEAVKSRTK